jgi:uncharacterized protein (TIGR02246 family)
MSRTETTQTVPSTTTGGAAEEFYAALERAWNAGDGGAYAAPFTADCDFTDIRGARHSGAGAVGGGHQAIFDSIYRGSTVQYEVTSARALADGVLLVQADAGLDVPAGPLAGSHRAASSAVLVETDGQWRAVMMHNTLVAPPAGPPPQAG